MKEEKSRAAMGEGDRTKVGNWERPRRSSQEGRVEEGAEG